jgi:general secretion pathway protein A
MRSVAQTERTTGESAILEFFGLRDQPFGVTPDPGYMYLTASHREALASLVYGIESKRGFSVLIAEPGMGKTTLLFYLMEKLKSTARTAFLFRPDSNTKELLESLLLDLGLEANPEDVPQMHEALKGALLEDLRAGKHFVWVIDEAQDLDASVLEAVRLLSNFETPESKLMHILLAGQPGLAEKLGNAELLQLRQRISNFVTLAPLSSSEVAEYISFRVRRAGGRAEELFSPDAQMQIAQTSEGIPRNINSLCFACLSLAYVEGKKRIGPEIVLAALSDREFQTTAEEPPGAPPAAAPSSTTYPRDFFASSLGADFTESAPRHRSSFGLFIFGLLVLPLALVVLESSSRLGALEVIQGPLAEAVVARVTGYNMHIPELTGSLPAALQPPTPPVPLPETERYFPPKPTEPDETQTSASQRPPSKPVQAAKAVPPAGEKQRSVNRVIFASRGQTLYDLARRYYSNSNGDLVAKIKSHNPQIPSLGTILQENQPVVLPYLAPEYPWKVAVSGNSSTEQSRARSFQ